MDAFDKVAQAAEPLCTGNFLGKTKKFAQVAARAKAFAASAENDQRVRFVF